MSGENPFEAVAVIALSLFALLVFLITDFSSTQNAGNNIARFVYAFAMTVAPTSKIAIFLDVIAAFLASIGFFKSLEESVVTALMAFFGIYFFFSLILNFFTAPV